MMAQREDTVNNHNHAMTRRKSVKLFNKIVKLLLTVSTRPVPVAEVCLYMCARVCLCVCMRVCVTVKRVCDAGNFFSTFPCSPGRLMPALRHRPRPPQEQRQPIRGRSEKGGKKERQRVRDFPYKSAGSAAGWVMPSSAVVHHL